MHKSGRDIVAKEFETLAVLLVGFLSFIGISRAELAVNCRVAKARGEIVLTAMSTPEILVGGREVPPSPQKITGVEVWSGSSAFKGPLLWSIEVEDGQPIYSIKYGEIPDGYSQICPKNGPPRPLKQGDECFVVCGLGHGRFKVTMDNVINLPLKDE
ncbi:MAG TPA: hypothetical protein VL403_12335 [Candidatus Kryptonia bacterium]|nr:hypothetical protein [Candidatus Kryptonia bacterium]